MASIETRIANDGSKSYRVKIRVKGLPTQTATFSRRTDARIWATKLEADIRDRRYLPTAESRKRRFADLCDRYEREVLPQRPKNSSNTRRHLAYWRCAFGDLYLADISPSRIVECKTALLSETTRRKKPRSNATVVRYLATLSHAFSVAVREWQWVESNPVSRISKPREPRGRERFLSEEERERLLEACSESDSRLLLPIVVLAISTGMRRGEIMNLNWRDVDFARGRITLTETKNGSARSVPLAGVAKTHLEDLARVRRLDSTLVFPGKCGRHPIEIKRPWEKALARAGLQDFRFHDLRHTAASYLAMHGATTVEIADVLGHKTLAMVRRYSHLTTNHTMKVVTGMNEWVFGPRRDEPKLHERRG